MERPPPKKIVGIDYGMVRIGLALSDELKIIANPLFTMESEKKLDKTVEKLLEKLDKHQVDHHYQIDAIVVGMPLMMNGKIGLLADEVNHFIEALKQKITIPIMTWDERLTSVQAERFLLKTEMSRKKRSKVVDVVSAMIILQMYLDYKNLQ
ncbi:MAG: Holliday junction resolvase RuvX [Waddliaceae bacterium]